MLYAQNNFLPTILMYHNSLSRQICAAKILIFIFKFLRLKWASTLSERLEVAPQNFFPWADLLIFIAGYQFDLQNATDVAVQFSHQRIVRFTLMHFMYYVYMASKLLGTLTFSIT